MLELKVIHFSKSDPALTDNKNENLKFQPLMFRLYFVLRCSANERIVFHLPKTLRAQTVKLRVHELWPGNATEVGSSPGGYYR